MKQSRLVDRCLMQSYNKAGQELDEQRQKNARSINEKIYLFYKIGSLILNDDIADNQLREKISESVKPRNLSEAVAQYPRIMRPPDDNYFDYGRKDIVIFDALCRIFSKSWNSPAKPPLFMVSVAIAAKLRQ